MYTQCPDCGTAFRVTAEVLKVAAGKVRCGGCANAFNALDYLSEEMPEQKAAAPDVEPQLPELKPEPLPTTDSGLPESISAEQSAALLKTLDELAGSDIRIEDTGVEWRLLDEDDSDIEDVDEVLEESPTPVDEFLTSTPEVVDSPEIFEASANAPLQTSVEELRFDDNTPLPEDFGFMDEATESAPVAEPESEPEPEPEPVVEQPQPDIALSDPHEWTDILDEFEELAGDTPLPLDVELDALLDEDAEADHDEDVSLDEEDSVDQEDALDEHADLDVEVGDDIETELDEILNEDDAEDTRVDALVDEEPVDDDTAIENLDLEFEDDGEEDDVDEPEEDLDEIDELDELDELDDIDEEEVLDVIDDDPQLDLIDEPDVEEHDIEAELALIGDEDEVDHEEVDDHADDDSGEHYVPPMTEEEHTVNMQIDQELLAIAVEDDDGFTSTIIIPEAEAERKAIESDDDVEASDDDAPRETPKEEVGFETIIMEGAEIKSAMDEEKRAADVAEAAELQAMAKAAEIEAASKAGPNRYAIIAGVVLLAILLIVQVIHQSREALATNAAFNSTVGPIYRALGNPLQPSWDITGWQFEATRGSAELETEDNSTDTKETLTVYSRIGNKSEDPLPYPLIRISLVDQVMESLGSHILEPKDYLDESLDPRKLVAAGESFEAAISVKLESEGVPSFQLHVCYRHSDHQLRCKDENFK